MATQKERNEEDEFNATSNNNNSLSDQEDRRDDEIVFSTSDSDTTLIRSMSCLTYHDRFRNEFGEETQQSDTDPSEDDIIYKRSKTDDKRVQRVTSRDSQFETYSEKNSVILYEPGSTKLETSGRPIEILVEQLPNPPNPPPKGLLEEWIINSLLDEPWFPSRVKKLHIGKWTSCTKDNGGKKLRRIIDVLVNNKPKLSNVRDIEIGSANVRAADLYLCDISRIFEFENLTRLKIRGSNGLTISNPRVCNLHSFIVEGTGCLPKSFVQGFAQCEWPNLTSLELWLGSNEDGYPTRPWSCDDLVIRFNEMMS